MFTIRPPPPARIAENAALQQRNAPVKLTPSVSSQISAVVSVNSADVRTAAAQTRAAGGPAAFAASNRRSTAAALLTSVVTAVPSAPASRMRLRTPSRASRSRAASTTCAPAAAIASAVAAPIPRLAPVTTATRPFSQCPPSGTGWDLDADSGRPRVQLLVRGEAQLDLE